MNKLLICLCALLIVSCKVQLFVNKKDIVQNKKGYLIFFKGDAVFVDYNDTVDMKFLKSKHKIGFRIDRGNLTWLRDLANSGSLPIGSDPNSPLETFSIIPVNLRYYLGDEWQRNSEQVQINYFYDGQQHELNYKIYDFRNILQIAVVRKKDIERIPPIKDSGLFLHSQ